MEIIRSREDLKLAIVKAEAEVEIKKTELKREAHTALESINPLTPVKAAIHKIKAATGFVSKESPKVGVGSIVKNLAAFLFKSSLTDTGSENKKFTSDPIRKKLDE